MTNCLLFEHSRGYALTWKEALAMPLYSAYAGRHKELAQKNHSRAHQIISCIEQIPVLGMVASLIERIVALVHQKLWKPPYRGHKFEELHFTAQDITFLCTQHFGLRHVTGRDRALREEGQGFRMGCSLSLSPQEAQFKGSEPIVTQFERGVDRFIRRNCFLEDLWESGPIDSTTARITDIAQIIERGCYSIIDYGDSQLPCDHELWGKGLGRYPKTNIHRSQIERLSFLQKEDLFYTPQEMQRITGTPEEVDKVFDTMTALVRSHLIRALRQKQMALAQTA